MLITPESTFFVFDVESIGLHGEGFAFGWVKVDRQGRELDSAALATYLEMAHDGAVSQEQAIANREWVKANVTVPMPHPIGPRSLRRIFWETLQQAKAEGCLVFADCQWPVEARFLIDAVDDNAQEREWQGPYPFHEIGTMLLAANMAPLESYPRRDNELPAHNPLADARQSARLLISALDILGHEREQARLYREDLATKEMAGP